MILLRARRRQYTQQQGYWKQQGETKKVKLRMHGSRSPRQDFESRFLYKSNSDSERPICQAVEQQKTKEVGRRRVVGVGFGLIG